MLEKITLMELYLIETLRAEGVTDEEIIRKVKNRQVESFQTYNEDFDFTGLYALDEAGKLERILHEGYEVTYLTFTGLENIIMLKFNKQRGKDYNVENYSIKDLHLPEEDAKVLEQMLSPNWTFLKQDTEITIKPIAQPPVLKK